MLGKWGNYTNSISVERILLLSTHLRASQFKSHPLITEIISSQDDCSQEQKLKLLIPGSNAYIPITALSSTALGEISQVFAWWQIILSKKVWEGRVV